MDGYDLSSASIIPGHGGGYLVAGLLTDTTVTSRQDVLLIRIDENGDMLWMRSYGDTLLKSVTAEAVSATDGCYVIAGYTFYGIDKKIFLLKVNESGDSLWGKEFELGGNATCSSIAAVGRDGYIISGQWTPAPGSIRYNVLLIRTDTDGEILWVRDYGDENQENGHCVRTTSDGSFIVCGDRLTYPGYDLDMILMKVDADGESLWARTFFDDSVAAAISLIETFEGNIVLTGYVESFRFPDPSIPPLLEVPVVCTDCDGNSLWSNFINVGGGGMGFDIALAPDSGFVITGSTDLRAADEGFLNKYSAGGDSLWARIYGRAALAVDNAPYGGFVMAGKISHGFEIECYVIKTDSLGFSPIGETPALRPTNISIFVSPNPFNSSCRISAPVNAIVEIFDINGRSIAEFDGGDQIWRPEASVGSGIYLVRAKIGGNNITKRVVYLK